MGLHGKAKLIKIDEALNKKIKMKIQKNTEIISSRREDAQI